MALSRAALWTSTALHGALLATLAIGSPGLATKGPHRPPPLAVIDCREAPLPPRSTPSCELPAAETESSDATPVPLAPVDPVDPATRPEPTPVAELDVSPPPILDPMLLRRPVRALAPTAPPPEPPLVAATATPAVAPATVVLTPLPGCNPPPEYPAVARRRGWQGTVVVAVTCDPSGLVTTATIVRSSGHEVLDAAALAAIRTWRFDGPGSSEQPVEFRLGAS